jgi:hypothetical protein
MTECYVAFNLVENKKVKDTMKLSEFVVVVITIWSYKVIEW